MLQKAGENGFEIESFFIGLFVLSALFPVSFQKACKLTFQDGATMRRQQR
jgi:hypothetical protein